MAVIFSNEYPSRPRAPSDSEYRSTAVTTRSNPRSPLGTSQLHDTQVPSLTVATALLRTSGVIRLSVPSSSSAPHRPQLDRASNQEMTSSSEGAVGMGRSLPTRR